MGCRILEGHFRGEEMEGASLYDSVTMTTFGPVFEDGDQAERFLESAQLNGRDPRTLIDRELEAFYRAFLDEELKRGD